MNTPISRPSSDKPLRLVRRLEGFRRLGIAASTYYDWANPKSARHKSELPKLIRYGGTAGMAGFFEPDLDAYISGFQNREL